MMVTAKDSRLENGMRVVTATMPQVESVSMGVWVGAGGRCEPEVWSGASHFIEHMLFKGTKRRSARDISQAIEGRGGDINAFTQEENTCYYARVAAEHTWEAMDVLTDMYLNASFAAADVAKEKGVVIEEILMYRDQPQHQVEEILAQLLWSEHALGRPLTGSPETVKGLGRRELMAYKAKHYTPRNTVIAVAGKVDHDSCVECIKALMGKEKTAPKRTFVPVTASVAQVLMQLESKDVEQAHLAIGFRGFGRHDRRRYALKLLSVILGENMSSRLFQVVREQHGLAYAINSTAHLFHDTGAFVISAGLDRDRLEAAVKLVVRELNRVKDTLVGKAELGRARDYAVGQIRMGLESTSSQMMWIGEHFMSYGYLIQPEEIIAALRAVTAEEIRRLAEDLLRPGRSSVAMVSPEVTKVLEKDVAKMVRGLAG
jgi:predicted Zn-dependent peptidase